MFSIYCEYENKELLFIFREVFCYGYDYNFTGSDALGNSRSGMRRRGIFPFGYCLSDLQKDRSRKKDGNQNAGCLHCSPVLLSDSGVRAYVIELDDLFHNLIGSLFGYFCIMAILVPIREKMIRFAPIAKALLIPCAASLTLGAVFFAYDRQPYGNMDVLPAAKQDMSAVQITTGQKLSDKNTPASI